MSAELLLYFRISGVRYLKMRHFINIDKYYLSILILRTFDAILISIDHKKWKFCQYRHSIDQYWGILMENKFLKINIDQYWSMKRSKTINIDNTAGKSYDHYWCNIDAILSNLMSILRSIDNVLINTAFSGPN